MNLADFEQKVDVRGDMSASKLQARVPGLHMNLDLDQRGDLRGVGDLSTSKLASRGDL